MVGRSAHARRRRVPGLPRPVRARRIAVAVVVAAVAGLLLGLLLLRLDRWLALPAQPATAGQAQVLIGTLVGAVITVAVFSVWMRTVVVGLVSDLFSPRTLSGYLEDRFQMALVAWMTVALVAEVVLLLGLPAEPSEPAPSLVVAAAVLIAVAALASILLAIQQATRNLNVSVLVSRLAREAVEVARSRPAPSVGPGDAPPPSADGVPVRAPETGWVRRIDWHAIVEDLRPGAVARLEVGIGTFVTTRSVVATVDGQGDGFDPTRVAEAFTIGISRSTDMDLGFAIGQLVDVAHHALTQGPDTATALEALVQIGAVFEQLLELGLQPVHLRAEQDRYVLDGGFRGTSDHLRMVAERLRHAAVEDPIATRHLATMLANVRKVAGDLDDPATFREADRQLDRLCELARRAGWLEADFEELQAIAATPGPDGGP